MTIQGIHHFIRRSGQRGQSLVIGGMMFVVLIGVVGLAVDGAVAYGYSVSIERAAAAAALAGVPYLPQNFSGAAPNAQSRATAEAKRNGIDPTVAACNCKITFGLNNNSQNLDVTITQTVPTFFMQALGFAPFPITRTAEAGYRPAIRLGSPDNEFGSTVSEIGTNGHFYVLRQKAWHVGGGRAEGDAFTIDPSYDIPTSTDVHIISGHNGNESTDTNFTSQFPNGWDDRGGENFRVTIPSGTTGEIQVYNAGFGPDDANGTQNYCENWQNFLSTAGKCNSDPNQNLHDDDGNQAKCTSGAPDICSGQRAEYNSVMYTLFQVNDALVRSNDTVLRRTIVYPVDAGNYGANPPSYVNVKNSKTIVQHYDAAGRPTDMRTYHSWTNINTETGADTVGAGADANAPTLVKANGFAPAPIGAVTPVDCTPGNKCPNLPAGTYRLRVDFLDANGNFVNGGSSNHAYAVRVVNPGTQPEAVSSGAVCSSGGVNCTVSGWEDAVVYTPLTVSGNNFIPLFELPKDYAGSTIDVDLYDFGDVSGSNTVSIIDPTAGCSPNPCAAGVANQPGLTITNNGVNRGGVPLSQHVSGANSQAPSGNAPAGPNDVAHVGGANAASWVVASGGGHPYNGTWIRVTIPIPGNYNPTAATGDFWYVNYNLSGTATDTFSFAVSARGGPVHLLRS